MDEWDTYSSGDSDPYSSWDESDASGGSSGDNSSSGGDWGEAAPYIPYDETDTQKWERLNGTTSGGDITGEQAGPAVPSWLSSALSSLGSTFKKTDGSGDWDIKKMLAAGGAAATAGVALQKLMGGGSASTSSNAGYQGKIPKYFVDRKKTGATTAESKDLRKENGGIAGLKGQSYFSPTTFSTEPVMSAAVMPTQTPPPVVKMAQGGLAGLKAGESSAAHPRYVKGSTDGMGDHVPASIDGKQPAKIAHGEFIIPSDVVSHLGNGNSDAGADVLYKMMERIRKARTGNPKQGKQINPNKFTPR